MILKIVDNKDFDLYDKEDRYMEGLEYELRHGIVNDETLKFKLAPSDVNDMAD